MDSGNIEEMGEAVLSVRRVRDVFRDAGWPERFVAGLPDVTLGVYLRQLEQPWLALAPAPDPTPRPQWPAWQKSQLAERALFDPVENAKAGLRYLQERYGQVSQQWETYRNGELYRMYLCGRRWPLSPAPRSPHGDPMALDIGRR